MFLFPIFVHASVVGITSFPLEERSKVISASMTGYFSQRHEVGMGLRYTQELQHDQLLDVFLSGAQHSRDYIFGGGVDFQVLEEQDQRPRISLKPFYRYQKFEETKEGVIGGAPTVRKRFTLLDKEIVPYLALPSGIKIDSHTDIYSYYASLSFGATLPVPIQSGKDLLVTLETNKNFGAASDYVEVLVSWVW